MARVGRYTTPTHIFTVHSKTVAPVTGTCTFDFGTSNATAMTVYQN